MQAHAPIDGSSIVRLTCDQCGEMDCTSADKSRPAAANDRPRDEEQSGFFHGSKRTARNG